MKLVSCLFLLVALASATRAQQAADFTDYVVQSLCVDDSGRPVDQLPIDQACTFRRPQWSADVARYRKHDWPNRLDEPATILGYQASDSVLERRAEKTIVVQTFDFGTDNRTFGVFDALRGDGGQVLLFIGDWASFAMTEDGSGGVQWFLGDACTSPNPDARFLSWLVFQQDISRVTWRSVIARLNIAATINRCPDQFNPALTRFRLDTIEMPFRIVEDPSHVRMQTNSIGVIVSEHFGGKEAATADHLERFFMAKGLGLVRWERWANGNVAQPRTVNEANLAIGGTDRCPRLAEYGAPDKGWLLVDCRTWTTLVRQSVPWRVRDFAWPAVRAFGAVD
jgi:hypothetical protein